MSELQESADKLISVIDKLDLDAGDAINDDVSTVAILAGGTLSPGQLANKDIQWVFSHLLGDIVEALDRQEPDALEQADPPLIAFVEDLEKAIGTIEDEDLKDQIDEILSGDDAEACDEVEGEEDEPEDEE